MKLILVCLLMLVLNKDYMYWHETRMLDWEYFRVKTSSLPNEPFGAWTVWVHNTQWYYKENKLYITIQTGFDKNSSWVKKGKETEHLLRHEQGHFDIAEVNARKYRKAVKEFAFNRSTLEKDMDSLQQYYKALCDKEQQMYDAETQQSQNIEAQERWIERIMKELEDAMNYWNPEIETTVTDK